MGIPRIQNIFPFIFPIYGTKPTSPYQFHSLRDRFVVRECVYVFCCACVTCLFVALLLFLFFFFVKQTSFSSVGRQSKQEQESSGVFDKGCCRGVFPHSPVSNAICFAVVLCYVFSTCVEGSEIYNTNLGETVISQD
jgi:hypothetical protein